MSFVIAAAGTGGHVYPGLAVAEALLSAGVARSDVLCVGGDRVESRIFPDHGFDYLELELRGLKRSLSPANLALPAVVLRAKGRLVEEIRARRARVVLGMGGYVTIPTAMAARRTSAALLIAEQNAGAGLANRVASRWAKRVFVSFPDTKGLPGGEWVGNPVRAQIASFDRETLREPALAHYGLTREKLTVGVFGGSLGAHAINEAAAGMVARWEGPPLQLIHLVGAAHVETYSGRIGTPNVDWVRKGFEERMDLFFAASDLVVARAGGSVAEITATATPSILVPGAFGSAGHQAANAAFLEDAGAAVVLEQARIADLGSTVRACLTDAGRLSAMAGSCRRIARPDASEVIARAMIEAAA